MERQLAQQIRRPRSQRHNHLHHNSQYIPKEHASRYCSPSKLPTTSRPTRSIDTSIYSSRNSNNSLKRYSHNGSQQLNASSNLNRITNKLPFLSKDFVPEREIWSNIILSLFCVVQLISAWTCVGYHIADYSEQTTLELGLSLGFLIGGNIIVTGLINTLLFVYRWKKTPIRVRGKISEENHEAWICTRVGMTLIGLAPISRYVELMTILSRLQRIERENLGEPILDNFIATSSKQSYSTRQTTRAHVIKMKPDDLNEELQKMQRLRRHFVQFAFDSAVVGLVNASVGAAPFAVSQGALVIQRKMDTRPMEPSTSVAVLCNFIFSTVWLASAATQFYPSMHYFSDADLQRGKVHSSVCGKVLMFWARFWHISLRLITFTLFTALFKSIIFAVVFIHSAIYFICLLIYRGSGKVLKAGYRKNSIVPNPLDERIRTKGVLSHLVNDIGFTYASIFDFFNAGSGKTRIRYIIFYFCFYLENAGMIGAWYADFPLTNVWYFLPSLLVIVTVQWTGAIFLQLYLFYFSSSPSGSALCGLCCPDEMAMGSGPKRLQAALIDMDIKNNKNQNFDNVAISQMATPYSLPNHNFHAVNVSRSSSLYSKPMKRNNLATVTYSSRPKPRLTSSESMNSDFRRTNGSEFYSDSFTDITKIPSQISGYQVDAQRQRDFRYMQSTNPELSDIPMSVVRPKPRSHRSHLPNPSARHPHSMNAYDNNDLYSEHTDHDCHSEHI